MSVGYPQFVYVAGAQLADNAFADAHRTLDYHHLPTATPGGCSARTWSPRVPAR